MRLDLDLVIGERLFDSVNEMMGVPFFLVRPTNPGPGPRILVFLAITGDNPPLPYLDLGKLRLLGYRLADLHEDSGEQVIGEL